MKRTKQKNYHKETMVVVAVLNTHIVCPKE